MRSSGRPSVVRPRWVCVGALALFLLMSVYQCGEVPLASESSGPVVSAVAKTVAPASVAEDSIAAGLVVSAEAVGVGDDFEVEVFVDMGASSLGAYQARLGWDASVFLLVEVSDGATAEFARAYQRAEAGALVFSQFNAQGADGRVSLLRVRFSVVGNGSGSLDLAFSVLDAAGTFASLLPSLVVEPTAIEVGGAAGDGIRGGLVVSAESVEVGDEFEVEVFVDLAGSGASLGAYQARLGWDASVFSLVEVSDGAPAEFARAYQRAEAGALVFSQFNAQGADGRVSLLRVRFSVVGGSGPSGLGLSFSVLDAAGTFASLLPSLVVEPTAIEIGGAAGDGIVAGLVVSAESVSVGDEVEVEVFVDLSGSGASLGAYEARLSWDVSVLSLVEVSDGSTPEFDRAYHREESGALVFSQFNAQGASGRLSLLRVRFSVVGSGSSGLGLSFSVLDAAGTFASLLPSLVVEDLTP